LKPSLHARQFLIRHFWLQRGCAKATSHSLRFFPIGNATYLF
jgi:hypothetical protein